jgi:3-hydroxyisobutyrate dehydrogenase-like beta-hydroxyacid dehydrogenase
MNSGERIGFVGAGLMGRGMAQNLLRAGHPLTLHVHRNRQGLDRLLALGAGQTDDLGELAGRSEVIILCVDNAETVRRVVDGLSPALRPGQLLIDATTSDPAVTREIAEKLRANGIDYSDSPVTGGPLQAEAGALGSLVGCDEATFPRIHKIVAHYSRTVERIGGIGSGHFAKLLNNFVTQGTTVLLAEAYGRARDHGLDWRALYSVMAAGAARSGTLEKMVKPALEGNFDGSQFTIRNALKDLTYFCELAENSERGTSKLAEAIRTIFENAAAADLSDRYVSALLDPQARSKEQNQSLS